MTEEEKLYGNNYQLRYEELKKKYRSVLAALNETIQEYEEQEKIIELMAKEINDGMFFDSAEEVIDYFKKKAREEK